MGKKRSRQRADTTADRSPAAQAADQQPATGVVTDVGAALPAPAASGAGGGAGAASALRSAWWWLAGFLLLTAVVYGNCLAGPFLFDDIHIDEASGWPSLGRLASLFWLANQRIVPDLTFALCQRLQGATTVPYHLVNLLIHAANGILLFLIVRSALGASRLRQRYAGRAPCLAAIAAGLYLLHPLNTESVSYISQRMQSLMALFQLLSLLAVIRSYASARPGWWQCAAVVAFILALDAKPHAVAMPLLALLYERIFLADSWRALLARSWRMHAGFALALAVTVGLMVLHFGDTDIGVVHMQDPRAAHPMTSVAYLQSEFAVLCHYLRLSVIPIGQSLDYMWPTATTAGGIYPYALIILALLAASLWALRGAPAVGFAALWFWGDILASSSVVARPDLCVEHRMYVPLQAIVVLAVLGVDGLGRALCARWPARWPQALTRRMALALALLAAAALATLTWERNRLYADDLAMWNDVIAGNPQNFRACQWLGNYHFKRKSYDEAAGHYLQAVRAYPNFYPGYDGLGQSYSNAGKFELAIRAFQDSIPLLGPREASREYENIAVVLCKTNELERAITQFNLAITADPDNVAARYSLGRLFMALHRDQEAAAMFRGVLARKPDHAGAAQGLAHVMGAQ